MSNTVLQPRGDFLLAIDVPRTTTLDGIELPDNMRQQEMCFGYVVLVGPRCEDLKPQDQIAYGPYAGKTVVLEGVQFRLLRDGQVEGKLEQTN